MRQGRIEPAIAEYAALVSEQPADLASANALGDLFVRARRSTEALPLYLHVADSYLREGFYSKAAGFYKKVLKFTPDDEATILRLADALARQGLAVEARAHLEQVAQARRRRGDVAGADQVLIAIAELDPKNLGARLEAARLLVRYGNPAGVERLASAIDALRDAGQAPQALAALRELVAAVPGDDQRRAELVEALVAAGQREEAYRLLSPEFIGDSPRLRRRALELVVAFGAHDEARARLRQWMAESPETMADLLAWSGLAPDLPPARRYLVVEVAVERVRAEGDHRRAAATLRAYLQAHPGELPALQTLVEACTDGDLDDWLAEAQEQLADVYASLGQLDEARFLLEEVFLFDPSDDGRRARLLSMLRRLGEADPDAAIDRLVALADDQEPEDDAGEPGAARPGEVDLAAALNVLALDEPGGASGREAGRHAAGVPDAPETLEAIFERLRQDAAPRRGTEGRQLLALGRTYLAAGLVEAALDAFQRAALDPEARAAAALALAETSDDLEDHDASLEWLERGADAAESPDDERVDAMRRLGEALEARGEPDRALAVWLEVVTLRADDQQAARAIERLSAEPRSQ